MHQLAECLQYRIKFMLYLVEKWPQKIVEAKNFRRVLENGTRLKCGNFTHCV